MINVLVFPCGSEVGLEIFSALKFSKDINLVGGSSVDDHGMYVFKNYVNNIPFVTDKNFIDHINKVVEENNIDYIYPAMDLVNTILVQNSDKVKAKIVSSDMKTCDVCNSKAATYELFRNEWFTPKEYTIETAKEFPLFAKPDVGYGSRGISIINNMEELKHFHETSVKYVLTEYLPNDEFTIDCFTDKDGVLRFTGCRIRSRIRTGISVNSRVIETDSKIKEIAETINSKLNFNGAWFFQVKLNANNEYRLLEIASRIAGTMSLYRNVGINFPLLSIYNLEGYELDIFKNDLKIEVDRALVNRYSIDYDYERVYIDFDDTITLKGKVNAYVMMYIYQCLNKGIELILVTKHINDIYETLKSLKIDHNIFKEIIRMPKEDNKFVHFNNDKKAIFIDDSFAERKAILDNCNIPVFDINAVESLIDWRL